MKSSLKQTLLVGLGCLSLAYIAQAEHSVELNVGASYTAFDHERDLDDSAGWALGAGYVVDPRWTVEAWLAETGTENEQGGGDVDATEYRLDALYHLDPMGSWTPFVVAGVGDMNFDPDGADKVDETRINLGMGVKKALSDRWGLRGDLRAFNGLDSEQTDYGLLVALTYKLGVKAAAVALDSDKDGVVDAQDSCPNTPAGAAVNAQGCALDSDGDGVYDHQDNCPATAKHLKVDANGCPMMMDKTVSIELNVLFDNDSSVVKQAYYSEVERVANFMNEYQDAEVEIQGFTDSRGAAAYNETLSQARANAVAKVLSESFEIATSRVSAKGYGEDKPVATNDTAAGRALNRRVVAYITSKVQTQQQR